MTNLVITILFGYLGTYRFSKKQNKLGFIYLLTGGLCGFGWLYDIYLSYQEYKVSVNSQNPNKQVAGQCVTNSHGDSSENKRVTVNSIMIDELRVKIRPIGENKVDKYDLYGEVPVTISSDLYSENIYITTDVDVETRDGTEYKEIKLGAITQKMINQVSRYLSHKFDGDYVVIYASLDVENSELIFSVPYDLEDDYLPLYSKIAGVTYGNRQEYLKEINADDLLLLEHSPCAEHDNAIKIVHVSTEKELGFVTRNLADDLIVKYGKGSRFYGLVTTRTGGGEKSYGCNIQIIRNIK